MEKCCQNYINSQVNNGRDTLCEYVNECCDFKSFRSIKQPTPEKIPQMTEEQFREIAPYINVGHIGNTCHGLSELDIESSIHDLKQAGYIRKSAVQEAEEMYQRFCKEINHNGTTTRVIVANDAECIFKQHEAIQELKSEIDVLKCQK